MDQGKMPEWAKKETVSKEEQKAALDAVTPRIRLQAEKVVEYAKTQGWVGEIEVSGRKVVVTMQGPRE